MRIIIATTLWAAASAFVLPNQQSAAEESGNGLDEWAKAWRDGVGSAIQDEIDAAVPFGTEQSLGDDLSYLVEGEFDDSTAGGGHDDEPTHTIYELLHKSHRTTKFAKLVDEHEDIVKLLNSTDGKKHTLFVAGDRVFDHLPDGQKPDADFMRALLRYHIVEGSYTAHDLVKRNTLATVLEEEWLGDNPQRLRASLGLGHININFFAKVVMPNIRATNGVIHAINHLLIPPTMVGRELTYFPAYFSTLLLAYEKTDFVKFIHNVPMKGSTVFAPTNRAFARLGPRANDFLFNSDKGRGYLKALLKYQIVANVTLYTDAVYGDPDQYAQPEAATGRHLHYDLTTLMHGVHMTADVRFFGPFTSMRLNGRVPVIARDAVAKNGVIQVVGRVPLPPHKHHGDHGHDGDDDHDGDQDSHVEEEEEVTVEDLIERLNDYVEEEDRVEQVEEL